MNRQQNRQDLRSDNRRARGRGRGRGRRGNGRGRMTDNFVRNFNDVLIMRDFTAEWKSDLELAATIALAHNQTDKLNNIVSVIVHLNCMLNVIEASDNMLDPVNRPPPPFDDKLCGILRTMNLRPSGTAAASSPGHALQGNSNSGQQVPHQSNRFSVFGDDDDDGDDTDLPSSIPLPSQPQFHSTRRRRNRGERSSNPSHSQGRGSRGSIQSSPAASLEMQRLVEHQRRSAEESRAHAQELIIQEEAPAMQMSLQARYLRCLIDMSIGDFYIVYAEYLTQSREWILCAEKAEMGCVTLNLISIQVDEWITAVHNAGGLTVSDDQLDDMAYSFRLGKERAESQRDKILKNAQRRKEKLEEDLNPLWKGRDEARAKMGDRWKNNPNRKNDHYERRKLMEEEYQNVKSTIDTVASLEFRPIIDDADDD